MENTLKAGQAISGLAFSTFSLMHVGGHLLTNFSFRLGQTALLANRELFHNPRFEIAVIGGSLVTHLCCSWGLVYKRGIAGLNPRKEIVHTYFHRWSGYALTAFMASHIMACRILPLAILSDPSVIGLDYVTYSIRKQPLMLLYITALSSAGIYHTLYGINNALTYLGYRKARVPRGTWINIFWCSLFTGALTALAISGLWEQIDFLHDMEFEKINRLFNINSYF